MPLQHPCGGSYVYYTMNNNKRNTAPSTNQLKIAGYMTNWDKEYIRKMAEQAKQRGDQRELDRLNKQYAKYGMSFGKLEGA